MGGGSSSAVIHEYSKRGPIPIQGLIVPLSDRTRTLNSGDIVLFKTGGFLPWLQGILLGCAYTHCGMIVLGADLLQYGTVDATTAAKIDGSTVYLFESVPSIDRVPCCFRELIAGVRLVRLDHKLYHYMQESGSPLIDICIIKFMPKETLAQSYIARLVAFVLSTCGASYNLNPFASNSAAHSHLDHTHSALASYVCNTPKNIAKFNCAQLVWHALEQMLVLRPTGDSGKTPAMFHHGLDYSVYIDVNAARLSDQRYHFTVMLQQYVVSNAAAEAAAVAVTV
jgi:hypothetical protein